MADKILVLADSGFGKTSSFMKDEELGIEGLDPKETYVITVTNKPLPGRGSRKLYPIIPEFTLQKTAADLKEYRRISTNNPALVAHAINLLGQTPIKNIIIDDTNYIMQDYYMSKALQTGWDAPKKIGYDMGKIFEAAEKLSDDKVFIMLAHGEEYDKIGGVKGYRMKTTGKMVQEYITPEGKFAIVLLGKSSYDDSTKKVRKEFVTNDDGVYTTAKSPRGMFESLYIPNDLGYVVKRVHAYYNGEEESTTETEEKQ